MDWWLFTFFIGAILSLFLPIEPTAFYLAILMLFALFCYFFKPLRKSSGLMLGGAWMIFNGMQYQSIWQDNQLNITELAKQTQLVQGEVLSLSNMLQELPLPAAQQRSVQPSVIKISPPEPIKNTIRQRFNLKVRRLNNQGVKVPFIIRLSWKNPDITLAQGQNVILKVKLKPAHGLANRGGFSYQTWLRSKHIVATGYVVKSKKIKKSKGTNNTAYNYIADNSRSIRQMLFSKYQKKLQQLPEAQKHLSPLLLALGFGDRSLLTAEVWQVLQVTGTGHLIAISGLHIGLVASGSFLLILGFMRYFPLKYLFLVMSLKKANAHLCTSYLQCINTRYFAIALSLLAAFGYGYLAGFSLPTVRALVMLILYWSARIMGIHLSIKRWFLLALFVLVVITPFSLFTGSFWLSCYAVVIIFITLWSVSPTLIGVSNQESTDVNSHKSNAHISNTHGGQVYGSIKIKRQWIFHFTHSFYLSFLHLVKGLIIIQLALLFLLMPLSALLFQQVSLVAFFANMLAVPFMSFIVIPLCLLSIIFLALNEPLSLMLMSLAVSSLQLLWQWLKYLADFSWAIIGINHIELALLLLGIIAGITLIFSWRKCFQLISNAFKLDLTYRFTFRSITLVLIFLSMFFVFTSTSIFAPLIKKENRPPWQLVMMDVGQGLSMLIIRDQQAILYDTGASYSTGFNMAEAVVLPYLKYRGINKLDKVILSHSDNDHAGSLVQLQSHIVIDKLMTNAKFATKMPVNSLPFSSLFLNVEVCRQGQSFSWQGLTFRQLWPEVQTVPQLHTDDLLKAPEGILKDKNDDSCVIEISDGYHKVLLTGDISTKVESKLLKKYPHLTTDVLLVPHHGSNTSSSDTFIYKLSPKIALVSAGFLNRWQMPRAKVVKRYQAHHINLINTADVGEVTLTFSEPTSDTAAIMQKMTQATVMKTVEQQNYRDDFWPFWFAN